MCTFVVKHTNGVPTRAKSRIVVLGSLDQHEWGKSDCFSPVVSIPMIHFLTALAVHNGRTLKQGDCKFAFIQATLLDHKLTIVKPPIGCPFSSPNSYWRIRKSLYGLRHAPWHWYNMFHHILQSPELVLQPCSQHPCGFISTPIPGKPPLYIAIYVDDIIYFSLDDDVEQHFCSALSQKVNMDFVGDAEWYLGIEFDWHKSADGTMSCCLL
jgi:hypothetical protein